ncbi:MAG: Nif3-like dinuclear metal center hexameric protein [Halodesulfurarchaeum sp.]
MDTATLVDRLDDLLDTDEYADLDASENGLQVGRRDGTTERVAVAVDAAGATIDRAVEREADMLLVHHGLSWDGIDRVTGRTHGRLSGLLEHDIDLYVSHLPLDGHQHLGNAAGVGDVVGLTDRNPFGELGPTYVGQHGSLDAPMDVQTLQDTLARELDHGGEGVQVLPFGPDPIGDVAIVTGSGADWLDEAVDAGVDAFITGEGKGKLYHQARESDITVFLGGHYATETFGVRSVAGRLEEWGLETVFIDAPTGL